MIPVHLHGSIKNSGITTGKRNCAQADQIISLEAVKYFLFCSHNFYRMTFIKISCYHDVRSRYQ